MKLIDVDELAKYEYWQKTVRDLSCAPTVEAEPIIHASKLVDWLGDSCCSNCKRFIDYTSNYCSWCGAKFDREDIRE